MGGGQWRNRRRACAWNGSRTIGPSISALLRYMRREPKVSCSNSRSIIASWFVFATPSRKSNEERQNDGKQETQYSLHESPADALDERGCAWVGMLCRPGGTGANPRDDPLVQRPAGRCLFQCRSDS